MRVSYSSYYYSKWGGCWFGSRARAISFFISFKSSSFAVLVYTKRSVNTELTLMARFPHLVILLASSAAFVPASICSSRRPRTTPMRMGLFNDPVGWVKRGIEVIQDQREVNASHILISGVSTARLEELKPQCTSLEKFAELAREYSTCPSGKKGGYLGTFGLRAR